MKLAIMQPYIFPYIGYFQLIAAVDKFVIYDDVNFINKGWVNRNNILVNGSKNLFTVPLKNASQNSLIRNISIVSEENWQKKLLKTFEISYKKAPYFNEIFSLVESVFKANISVISELCVSGLETVLSYLEMRADFIPSSVVYESTALKGPQRILDICKKEKATLYINPIGGQELYDRFEFEKENIKLKFLQSSSEPYKQFNKPFINNLSIIDVLMFNPPETVKIMLTQYELI